MSIVNISDSMDDAGLMAVQKEKADIRFLYRSCYFYKSCLRFQSEAEFRMMSSDFITQIPLDWYWVFLLVSVFIENIFPPYPGDTVVVFAGYIAGTGHLKLPWLIFAVVVGNLASAAVMYYFGLEIIQFMVRKIKNEGIKKVFSQENLQKTHGWFERYGFWTVVFSRFSAGFRFFVAIAAGMARMHIALFLFAFLIATVLWNGLLVYGGYALGHNWAQVLHYLEIYSGIVGAVIVTALLYLIYRFWKKRRG